MSRCVPTVAFEGMWRLDFILCGLPPMQSKSPTADLPHPPRCQASNIGQREKTLSVFRRAISAYRLGPLNMTDQRQEIVKCPNHAKGLHDRLK